MLLLPYRLESDSNRRFPLVTGLLAVGCVLVQCSGLTANRPDDEANAKRVNEVVTEWLRAPRADPGERFRRHFVPASAVRMLQTREGGDNAPAWFRARAAEAVAVQESHPARPWSLVPEGGPLQRGLLTHMFLHGGWLHLLGNMLFLLLMARFLEDLWGRRFFLAFYLVGGVVAGLAHLAVSRGSPVTMYGASGAVAACMGAYVARFGRRRMRFLLMVEPLFASWRFWMPAGVWGVYWVAGEALAQGLTGRGGGGGVAYMAHVGGFAFGAVFALAFYLSGLEERLRRAGGRVDGRQHPEIAQARIALGRGQVARARGLLREVTRHERDNTAAVLELALLEWKHGTPADAASLTQRFLEFPRRALSLPQRAVGWKRLTQSVKRELLTPAALVSAAEALCSIRPVDTAQVQALLKDACTREPALQLRGALMLGRAALEHDRDLATASRYLDWAAQQPGAADEKAEFQALAELKQALVAELERGAATATPGTRPANPDNRGVTRAGPGETPPGMGIQPPGWPGFPDEHPQLGRFLGGRRGRSPGRAWRRALAWFVVGVVMAGVSGLLVTRGRPVAAPWFGLAAVIATYASLWVIARRYVAIGLYEKGLLAKDIPVVFSDVEHLEVSTAQQWLPPWLLALLGRVPPVAAHTLFRVETRRALLRMETFRRAGRAALDRAFVEVAAHLVPRLVHRVRVGGSFEIAGLRFSPQGLWAGGRRVDYAALAPVDVDSGFYRVTLSGEEYPLASIPVDAMDACLLPQLLPQCARLPPVNSQPRHAPVREGAPRA